MIDENLIYEAQRMLHERYMYFQRAANKTTTKEFEIKYGAVASAFSSACDILLAAVQGDVEALKEFDYYRKDK